MDRVRMIQPAPGAKSRIYRFFLSFLIGALSLTTSGTATSFHHHTIQQPDEMRALTVGIPIERELTGAGAHSYQITLNEGQYLGVVVEQRGIDVIVALVAPDGKRIVEVDSQNGMHGPEAVSVIAEAAGDYQLKVRAHDQDSAPGRYQIKVEALRAASTPDRDRVKAQLAFWEGEKLLRQMKPETLPQAKRKYEEALSLWTALGDHDRESDTLAKCGLVQYLAGELQESLKTFQRELLLEHAIGDREKEAQTLGNVASVYAKLGELQKGIEHYQRALALSRSMNDRPAEAQILTGMGLAYYRLGEYESSLAHHNQALSLRRDLGDRLGEAGVLTQIGMVYNDLGENRRALEYHLQALPLSHAADQPQTEGAVFCNIAGTYQKLADYQQALDYYEKGLALLRKAGDHVGEASVLGNIGVLYSYLGEHEQGLKYARQALALSRRTGDRPNESYALNIFGDLYKSLGDRRNALECYRQALSLKRLMGNRHGEAITLADIAVIQNELGERDQALENLQQALRFHQEAGNLGDQAGVLNYLGIVYGSMGEKQKAVEYFRQELQLRRVVSDQFGEASALSNLASVMGDLGQLEEASAYSEASLKLTESLRAKVISQALRSTYLASAQDRYDLHIDLMMRMERVNPAARYAITALQTSERSRARSLLELLAEARADIRQGVDLPLLERERDLQRQLDKEATDRIALLSGKHTDQQAAAAERKISDLTAQFNEIEAQIRAASPRYAALTQPQPLSAPVIQQMLDADTILLEYALGKERSYLWVVTPDSIAGYQLPPRAEIEAAAARFRGLIISRRDETDASYRKEAGGLSRMLLGPVTTQLGTKRLVIVASGVLQYVPFAVLPVPETGGQESHDPQSAKAGHRGRSQPAKPLIVEHEIVNLPSASALAVLRRESAGRQAAARRQAAVKAVAVLADPVFSRDDPRVEPGSKRVTPVPEQPRGAETHDAASSPALASELERAVRDVRAGDDQRPLTRLPFSRQEAEAIMTAAPKGSVLMALDFRASRATALSEELSQYRIVHFATHGLLDSEHPELSGLVLSLVDQNGKPQEGYLRLHEIYNLRLSADVVVLSACRTGLGKEIKGEGLVGLTRGFMFAGASRVVASLWQVDDVATADLMKRFYRRMLFDSLRPAAALRTAQIEMWKKKQWRAPFYWGAFELQGEWR